MGPAGRKRRARVAAGGILSLSATLAAGCLLLPGLPAAADPAYPSQQQVDQAEARVTMTGGRAEALQAKLDASYATQHRLEVTAEVASEAFNAAQEVLGQAQAAEQRARQAAAGAQRVAEQARVEFGKFAAATYRTGGDLAAVSAVLESRGPQDLVDTVATMERITGASGDAYARYARARDTAEAAETTATLALHTREQAATAAQGARDVAATAADEGARAVAAVQAQQQQIIAALAAARNTSVQLEQQRQDGLRAEAEAAAAAKAVADALAKEKAAAAAAQAKAAAQAQAAAQAKADQDKAAADAAAAAAAKQRSVGDATAQAAAAAQAQREAAAVAAAAQQAADAAPPKAPPPNAPPPNAPPPNAPPPNAPPPNAPASGGGQGQPTKSATSKPTTPGGSEYTSAGAAAAIAFAKAQLGKPYVWGAAGPNAFDCSGLMLRAWQAGGVTLPRVASQQYAASTPVDFGSLRPGDLLFWSTSSSPFSIYHVAMYIGGGQMIQAPNSRRPVEITGMFWMGTPDFYGRV